MSTINNSLRTKEYAKAYLIYGQEAYLRKHYKNALMTALVAEGDNLNYSYYEGKDINASEVMAQLSTMPFMAEHRVVIVENSGWFAVSGKKGDKASDEGTDGLTSSVKEKCPPELIDAVKKLEEDVIVIFVEENPDKRSKLFKAVSAVGIAEEFGEQEENMVGRWLLNQAGALNLKMSSGTALYLMTEVGRNMTLLENEFNKLASYCMDRGEITSADVDEVCTHQIANKIFDMINAISGGRTKAAMDLYSDLVILRESPFHILALLVRQYNQMLIVKDGLERGHPYHIIGDSIGLNEWQVKKVVSLCRRLSMEDIENSLNACALTDEGIKKGNFTDSLGIELLITELSAAGHEPA